MKLNEYWKMQIMNLGLYILFFSLLFIGVYLENLLLVCISLFIGIFAFIYYIYNMKYSYRYAAKKILKKIKKEDLEGPITKKDFFKGTLLFKLAKRYGPKKAALIHFLLTIPMVTPFLLLLFYFTGWPKDVSSLIFTISFVTFFMYIWETKMLEEVMRRLGANEDE